MLNFGETGKATKSSCISSQYVINKEDLHVSDNAIGFGDGVIVHGGTWKGQKVAIKQFQLLPSSSLNKELLEKEAKMLLELDHRNIVKCFGVCNDDMLALVMEKAEINFILNGEEISCHSLREVINEVKDNMDMSFKTKAVHQVCKGMVYLHQKNIVHNDLKAANVLVFETAESLIFKLCDFGESRRSIVNAVKASMSFNVFNVEGKVTAPFVSPEKFRNPKIFNKKCDIYAFGMLMYEVLRSDLDYPWENELSDVSLYSEIKAMVLDNRRPTFKEVISEDSATCNNELIMQFIIEDCWQQDPKDRPDIEQVLNQISYLNVQTNIESDFMEGIESSSTEIYKYLFDDYKLLSLKFVKEVGKWKKETMIEITDYFDELIVELRNREKKANIINLHADGVGIAAGVVGVIGFGLLFTPVTFIPGAILCGVAGAVGGAGGITGGGVFVNKRRKGKAAQQSVDNTFKNADIDIDEFFKLVKYFITSTDDLSTKLEKTFEYVIDVVQCYLLRVWSWVRGIYDTDLVISDAKGLLNNLGFDGNTISVIHDKINITNKVSGKAREALAVAYVGVASKGIFQIVDAGVDTAGTAANVGKVFINISKGAQALQGIGFAFSLIGIAAGIHGVVKNREKITDGNKNELADILELYSNVIRNFWRMRELVEEPERRDIKETETSLELLVGQPENNSMEELPPSELVEDSENSIIVKNPTKSVNQPLAAGKKFGGVVVGGVLRQTSRLRDRVRRVANQRPDKASIREIEAFEFDGESSSKKEPLPSKLVEDSENSSREELTPSELVEDSENCFMEELLTSEFVKESENNCMEEIPSLKLVKNAAVSVNLSKTCSKTLTTGKKFGGIVVGGVLRQTSRLRDRVRRVANQQPEITSSREFESLEFDGESASKKEPLPSKLAEDSENSIKEELLSSEFVKESENGCMEEIPSLKFVENPAKSVNLGKACSQTLTTGKKFGVVVVGGVLRQASRLRNKVQRVANQQPEIGSIKEIDSLKIIGESAIKKEPSPSELVEELESNEMIVLELEGELEKSGMKELCKLANDRKSVVWKKSPTL